MSFEDKIENYNELIKIALHKNVAVFKHIECEFHTLEMFKYAAQINGCAINFASKKIRNDKELIMIAVDNNPKAINYVSNPLRYDPDIIKIYNNN